MQHHEIVAFHNCLFLIFVVVFLYGYIIRFYFDTIITSFVSIIIFIAIIIIHNVAEFVRHNVFNFTALVSIAYTCTFAAKMFGAGVNI